MSRDLCFQYIMVFSLAYHYWFGLGLFLLICVACCYYCIVRCHSNYHQIQGFLYRVKDNELSKTNLLHLHALSASKIAESLVLKSTI